MGVDLSGWYGNVFRFGCQGEVSAMRKYVDPVRTFPEACADIPRVLAISHMLRRLRGIPRLGGRRKRSVEVLLDDMNE